MGSACCIAARDGTLPNRNVGENLHRNAIYSPSWNFQWDNRRRVAVEIENPSYRPSREMNMGMEVKREIGLDGDNSSDGGSPLASFGTPMFQKSRVYEGLDGNSSTARTDLSMEGHGNIESPRESPEIASTSAPMPSFSVQVGSSFSTQTADLLSTHTRSLYTDITQSRRARHSPGRQLLKQVSDNLIPGMRSPNSNSVSEGRPSFVLSTCSNELTAGSMGGSSDGCSMRTFSELVASSQRERWSFNGEYLGSGRSKISESSSRFSYSPSIDLQTCGGCSKLLTERSWRINELQAVAVLTCGHVYHAECLETMTPDADRYDPSCPTCMVRDKLITRMSRKARRAESELKSRSSKISRDRVMDSLHRSGSEVPDRHAITEAGGKVNNMEPGSSSRGSFAKPFLKRHFSLGYKWSGFLLENDSSRKKGFWARYRKD